jgi:hypothetical protein
MGTRSDVEKLENHAEWLLEKIGRVSSIIRFYPKKNKNTLRLEQLIDRLANTLDKADCLMIEHNAKEEAMKSALKKATENIKCSMDKFMSQCTVKKVESDRNESSLWGDSNPDQNISTPEEEYAAEFLEAVSKMPPIPDYDEFGHKVQETE